MKCRVFRVKYKDKNLPQQEVSGLELAGSHHLVVNVFDPFIAVDYKTMRGDTIKRINYNIEIVAEWVCEGVFIEIGGDNK